LHIEATDAIDSAMAPTMFNGTHAVALRQSAGEED
jgi:hypothetical protein